MPKKDAVKPVTVTLSIPRELADACLALADDPHEFKWGPFLRSQIRQFIASKNAQNTPKARLAALLNK